MRVVALVAWLGALVGLAALSPDDAFWYIVAGIPLTLVVGWLVDRWWVVAVPVVLTLALFGVALALTGGCRGSCDGESAFALVLWVTPLIFTVPAIVLLAAGVAARRAKDAGVLGSADQPLHR